MSDAKLDRAIDGAVREMLDVEPPPGLRGRVLDRIEAGYPVASAFRRKALWLAVPIAAAAVILLAVLAPWRQAVPPAAPATSTIATAEPEKEPQPLETTKPAPPPATTGTSVPPGKAAVRAQRSIRPGIVVAAATDTGMDVLFPSVEPLPGPASIVVERLASPPPPAMSRLGIAPLEIRALEVTPLTETPRERREE